MNLHVAVIVLGATALQAGCRTELAAPALVEQSRLAMGSALRVAVWTADQPGAGRAIDQVYDEFDRIEAALSVWRPESDVQRLNAAAGRGPIPVGADTRAVLEAAAEASRFTEGKFDVTFGALADVWRFDHDQDNRVPTAEEIAARLPLIDYTAVRVDETAGDGGDHSGPASACTWAGSARAMQWSVPRRCCAGRDYDDFLIQAGGDLYAAGRRGDRPWRVGLYDPRGSDGATFASIDLADETFSTSGDYERFFVQDGVRYHHLLDPDTGQPARSCRSVTILARSP